MDLNTIYQIFLEGGLLLTIVGWVVDRKVNSAKRAKTVHDVYKKMYEETSETLLFITNDRENDREVLENIKIVLQKLPYCPHFSDCPGKSELLKHKRREQVIRKQRDREAQSAEHDNSDESGEPRDPPPKD